MNKNRILAFIILLFLLLGILIVQIYVTDGSIPIGYQD